MEIIVENNPDNEKSLKIIKEALSKRAFLTIIASCRVFYEGRAVSRLGLGDRTVIIKGDGAFLVHQDRNLEPVNWQPPKTKINVEMDKGLISIRGARRSPPETLQVEIHHTNLIYYFIGEDIKALELAGYEADMGDMIFEDPDLVEKGFRPTSREYHTPNGFIDILGKDIDGNVTVLELKSRKAGVNAVKQLRRYVDCFSEHKGLVRGVLVAPSITDDALELLEKQKMEFRELNPPRELKKNNNITLEDFMAN